MSNEDRQHEQATPTDLHDLARTRHAQALRYVHEYVLYYDTQKRSTGSSWYCWLYLKLHSSTLAPEEKYSLSVRSA